MRACLAIVGGKRQDGKAINTCANVYVQ
eukprot:SAG11_NODE_19369_length_468_cov_0.712737_2_plen_27_part_01